MPRSSGAKRPGSKAAGGDPREQLLAVLEQMGQRMRAARDWIEPSADQKVQLSWQVDKWFAENGYYDH
jgi:hypothetical protein